MARYINADNLINELSAACMPIYEKGITGILGDNSSIADIINEQPTADVQEVQHGEWKNQEPGYRVAEFMCSVCHSESDKLFDYCPDCGARMDGDRNG